MRWKMAAFAVIAVVVLAAAVVLFMKFERQVPTFTFAAEPRFIGAATPLSLVVEDRGTGLRKLGIYIQQSEKIMEVLKKEFPAGSWLGGPGVRRHEAAVTIDTRALGLVQGPAILMVEAFDRAFWGFGRGSRALRQFPITVDTVPPRVDLLSTAHNVNRGGAGLVVFRAGEELARAGVEVGELFFPAYQEKSGGPRAWVGYFVIPYDAPAGVRIALVAADPAGNVTRRTFPFRILSKKFPSDTIELSDSFLQAKMPEFAAADPSLGTEPLEIFLKVNREWRVRDHRRLGELTLKSGTERLWSDAFIQMKNTKNMANYPEARTYRYRGRDVDRQTHLGLDLASTAGALVPAANAGEVAFAGDLGIYGQVVLLDHGQGIFSLYAHLSGISASQGQRVEKGQIIGSSGQTGMAGGDHLHFGVLIAGVFTSPVEWLDQHWIDDNIKNKLVLLSSPAV